MSRSHRAARLIVASSIALVVVVTLPTAAAAQGGMLGRIARLPFDLLSKILMNDPAPVNVIIEAPQDVVDSLAQSYNVTIVKRLYSGAVISGTPAQLDAVAHDGRIASMAIDRAVAAMQTVDTQATGANQVWPGLLKSGYTGSGVGVAVIDSGIASHPDLNGRVYYSYDLLDPNNGGRDWYGHGTHVAGIIAGNGTASVLKDRTLWSGVAQGAQLINVRVLGNDGSGMTSDVVAGHRLVHPAAVPVQHPRDQFVARSHAGGSARGRSARPGREPRRGRRHRRRHLGRQLRQAPGWDAGGWRDRHAGDRGDRHHRGRRQHARYRSSDRMI